MLFLFFFFNDTATTEIYTLSLHDALPISASSRRTAAGTPGSWARAARSRSTTFSRTSAPDPTRLVERERSEEHTSELQSRQYLVCRLLLEKKKERRMRTRDT